MGVSRFTYSIREFGEHVQGVVFKKLVSRATRAIPAARWSDPILSVLEFVIRHRRLPRVREPVLFNDHLLKLKIDGSLLDPLRQFVTDKEYVKHYIAGVVGNEYTLKTFEVLRDEADVDQFVVKTTPCVIKPTHMSGPVLLCFDPGMAIDGSLLRRWLRSDYYQSSREANYRFLEPKIIIEEFFSGDRRTVPQDYKIFCFHGQPRLIEVDADRFVNHTRNFYDTAWNRLQLTVKYPAGDAADPKPTLLNTMLDVARDLSMPFSSIRVDMYASDDILKVGELTNCHGGGGELIRPEGAELWLGGLFTKREAGSVTRGV